MPDGEIAIDDPRSADIRELLHRHLTFAHTPPQDVHAPDIEGLLDPRHGEVKSMHTAADQPGDRHHGGFTPARSLYASAGFQRYGPFADYQPSPSNTFMSLLMAGGTTGE